MLLLPPASNRRLRVKALVSTTPLGNRWRYQVSFLLYIWKTVGVFQPISRLLFVDAQNLPVIAVGAVKALVSTTPLGNRWCYQASPLLHI